MSVDIATSNNGILLWVDNSSFKSFSFDRYLEWGRAWSFLEGEDSSQTQYASSDDGVQVFNHPIDVHFASASIQGWPRMVVQAWELDEFGRSILAGYGFVHMPTNPGKKLCFGRMDE